MNWSAWLYGLLSAVLSSAAGAVALVVVDPATFNLQAGWRSLANAAGVMALIAFANYLKSTPPPKPTWLQGPNP